MPAKLDEALTALASIDTRAIRYEIDTLRAIRDWAITQLGIDFQPGDRVEIVTSEPAQVGGGWEHYREALAPGQTGIAGEITFNTHSRKWQTVVAMDRTWSVHARGDKVIRFWSGPADETPDGYEPPSGYDRERYPNGKVNHFAMDVHWLAKTEVTR